MDLKIRRYQSKVVLEYTVCSLQCHTDDAIT